MALQVSAASAGAATGGAAAIMIGINGWLGRRGISLGAEELAAWATVIMPPVHFAGTCLSIFAAGLINRLSAWAGMPVPADPLLIPPKP